MNIETNINEYNKDDEDLVSGVVNHNPQDDEPYRVFVEERWVSEADLNRIIRALQALKKIRRKNLGV